MGADRKWKLHQEMSIENVLNMQQQVQQLQEHDHGQEQEQEQEHQKHPKPQHSCTGTPRLSLERHNKEVDQGQQENQDTVQLRQRVVALEVRVH